MIYIAFISFVILLWIVISVIREYNEKKKTQDSKLRFFEDSYTENLNTIKVLQSEVEKLQQEKNNFKNMYEQLPQTKDIMSILKILDDNNSPDITKQKLSKLWDVLPYYPPDWPIRKWIVKRRDNYTCQKCNKNLYYAKDDIAEVHHIKPLSIGGTNEIKNLITLCHNCHKKIHDDMYKFPFSHDSKEALYDDWTYYKIFRYDPKRFTNVIDSEKQALLRFDSYIDDEPDTDKYYNISYWEDKIEKS